MINIILKFICKVINFLFTLINMSSKRKNYYAVSTGRKIGIYTSYGNAFDQTHGYKGGVLKGYNTLQEAKQDMKVNGYDEPPIFNHKDVLLHSSQSDSDLCIKVSYQPTLPTDTLENRLIAEIEHPEFDIENLYTKPCESDTAIKTVASSPNTSPKKYIHDVIQEVHPATNNEANVITTNNQNDSNKTDCESCETMINLLHQMNNKLNLLEQKFEQQIHTNNELLSAFSCYQNEQKNLQDQKNKEIDEIKSMVEKLSSTNYQFQLNEIEMKCNNLCHVQAQLSLDVEDIQYRQKLQQTDICEIVKNTQSLGIAQENVNERLPAIDVKEVKISSSEKSQMRTMDLHNSNDKINSTSETDHSNTPSSNQSQKHVKSDDDNQSSMYKHSPTKADLEFEDIDSLNYHPKFTEKKASNTSIDRQRHKFQLHNSSTKNILLGDSNMKSINRVRLDNTKNTEVRTYRGASVKTLNDTISSSESVYPLVEKVTICIGSIDCARRYIDANIFHDDYLNLLKTTKQVFPSADIAIISVPPQRSHHANNNICKINHMLASLAKKMTCVFYQCEALWMHVDNKGVLDEGILADNIHLTPWGISLLLQPIISFFFGRRNQHSKLPFSRDHTDVKAASPSPNLAVLQSSQPSQTNDMKVVTDYFVKVLSSGLQSMVDQLKTPNPNLVST